MATAEDQSGVRRRRRLTAPIAARKPRPVVLIVMSLSLVFIWGAIFALASVLAGGSPTRSLIDSSTAVRSTEEQPTRLTSVTATLLNIDAAAGQATARISIVPAPRYLDGEVTDVDMVVLATNADGTNRRTIPAGESVQPFTVSLPLTDGVIAQYPFDSYETVLLIRIDVDETPIPLAVSIMTNATSYNVIATPLEDTRVVNTLAGAIGFELGRDDATYVYSLGVMALMLALAVVGLRIIWVTLVWQIEPPPWLYGFFIGALFALPPLRSSLPGAPPPGAIVDFLSFYPTVAVISVAMLVSLTRWISSLRPTDGEVEE